ncbi:MAG TPA: hypothetical protein VMB22_07375 [Verrucomicrobiae bacterium]|nr:hypothetical protein [Verrucomicrobiae bacterium]
MKTPREILLERHQAAAPKLDAIRQSAVAAVCDRRISNERRSQTTATMILKTFWLELVWPCRRIWAGLAAVWVLIFVFNLSQRDPSELMARKTPSPSPQMVLAFWQQEKLLDELMGPDKPPAVEPPQPFLPQPRSELRMETFAV